MSVIRHLFSFFCLVAFCTNALAQTYVSMELGGHYGRDLSFINTSNDRPSICDEFINPLFASVPGCTDPNPGEGDQWVVDFDRATGVTASFAIGRQITRLIRTELEYLFHSSGYKQVADVASGTGTDADKLNLEVVLAREHLGDISSHSLMLNSYASLTTRRYGPWIPYVGAGVGASRISTFYGFTWYRNRNPDAIGAGEGLPNAEEIRNNLAGTISAGSAVLTDEVLSWQLMVGVDYMISRRTSVGLKLRRVDFLSFEPGKLVSDPLRSHVPNNRRDGSEPVYSYTRTSDLETFSAALVMRYHL